MNVNVNEVVNSDFGIGISNLENRKSKSGMRKGCEEDEDEASLELEEGEEEAIVEAEDAGEEDDEDAGAAIVEVEASEVSA